MAAPAFMNGRWRRFGPRVARYSAPKGWQALLRTSQDEQGALAVFHAFGDPPAEPLQLDLPGPGPWVVGSVLAGDNRPKIDGGPQTEGGPQIVGETVSWVAPAPFTAAAAWLRPAGDRPARS